MSQFSNQLQASIKANGFTQTEVYDQVGISQGQMSVEEDSPVYRSRMPKKLRNTYDRLGAAALEDAAIAQVIIGTSNLTK